MNGEWAEQGACVGVDQAIFFPERGESTAPAKAYCLRCPVQVDCLNHALAVPEKVGIWGGLSERERRRIRRDRNRSRLAS